MAAFAVTFRLLAGWAGPMWAVAVSGAESVPSFRNDVMAVFSRSGCNSGPCHGNRNGKGGFKLSLRGEDPDADHDALLADLGGRRVDRIEPDRSLVLLKPTVQVPHEGGRRIDPGSLEFRILRDWLRAGMPDDRGTGAVLESMTVDPPEVWVTGTSSPVRLAVTARFANGEVRVVTDLAVYEASSPQLVVTPSGEVRAKEPCESAIVVRYLDRQTAVPVAFLPERPEPSSATPVPRTMVDDHVFAKLRRVRLAVAPPCPDSTFLRRLSLDLLGVIPDAAEARAFAADASADKRERAVERCLERPEFSDYWALKWLDVFRSEERALDRKGVQLLREWLVGQLASHAPVDRMVREILTARGSTYAVPAANWLRAHRTPVERAEAVAQVFLGTRLQCAQCHHHPYERWTQTDYHDWASVFAKVDYKVLQNLRTDENDKHEFIGEQRIYINPSGRHLHPRTGKASTPRVLGDDLALGELDPLAVAAAWVTSPANRRFARAQVNRVWFHLMGRGLVEPVDDFRETNPASHPALLDALAGAFVESEFDLRHLIRLIVNSHTYQTSTEPPAGASADGVNYSHTIPRRLGAEVLLDSLSRAAGVALEFPGYPPGTRAVEVPTTAIEGRRRRRGAGTDWDVFLRDFGKPPRQMATECERSSEPGMSQVFQMISGGVISGIVSDAGNCLQGLTSGDGRLDGRIEELFWRVLSRGPTPAELESFERHVASAGGRVRERWEDLLWGLLNAKEFILRP